MTLYKIGTPVSYKGDVSNQPGKGAITSIMNGRFGTQYEITLEAEHSEFGEEYGLEERKFWVSPNSLDDPFRWEVEP